MITVKNNNVHISPRKVRGVVDLIRGKNVGSALKILRFCEKKEISILLTKLINSGLAIASLEKTENLDEILIKNIKVDEGRQMKRIMPRAQGRAYRISKRSSYVTIDLGK